MYKVITIGDVVIDTHLQIDNASVECDVNTHDCQLCLDYASKIPITGSFQSLGGNAANVACGTVKLGLKTAALASLGDDSNGKLAKQELKKFGVDTSLVNLEPNTTTRYSVVLNYKGERTILSFHKKRKYSWPKQLPATEWIYYTGLSEGFEPLQEKVLKFLSAHPTVRLAFNPGSYQLKQALETVKEMASKSDILIVNLQEAEKILGTTLAQTKSVKTIIHGLLQRGAKEVAITDAQNGAWAGNAEQVWQTASFPVAVVAKTGAGDAFSSGYLSARIYGHDMPTALRWGIANSCSVIGQMGAQNGLLDVKGINKTIAKFPNIQPTII